MKVIVKIKVTLKDEYGGELPDLGLGPGVIGFQEIVFDDVVNPKEPMFIKALLDAEDSVIDAFIEPQMEIAFEGYSPDETEEYYAYFQAEPPAEERPLMEEITCQISNPRTDGMCCCNCRFLIPDHSHPTTDGGNMTQQRGFVCAGFLFTEPEKIVFSGWSKHGLCEMWDLRRDR